MLLLLSLVIPAFAGMTSASNGTTDPGFRGDDGREQLQTDPDFAGTTG